MNSHPIRAAVFDIGMVLLRFDFNLTIAKLHERCRAKPEEIPVLFWGSGLVDAYDRGTVSTGEFANKASTLIGFQGPPEDLISAWSDIFSPNAPMVERARRWKQRGMPLYLLSNTCEAHIEFFLAKFDVFRIFDGAVYSCREKCMKPERMIYERLMERYRLDAASTLLIDDRVENVAGARDVGMAAIQYEHDPALIEALNTYALD